MSEGAPKHESEKMSKSEYIRLAVELSEHAEVFPFSGISHDAYTEIQATQDPELDRVTSIVVLAERFSTHGMKIVLGKNPQSGNVFVVPGDSDDIEADSLFPRHLLTTHSNMNPELKKLILASKKGIS